MTRDDFLREQYRTLRSEIKSIKQRLFLIVFIGLIAVPLIAFLAESPSVEFVAPLVPFLVMVITVLFFAEQSALMRCGHFIRAHIEPHVQGAPGWESWLESKPDLRLMDKYFAGCFMVVFFVFYFVAVALAINKLWKIDAALRGPQNYGVIAGSITFAIGAVWMVITIMHHWRSATTTSD